MVVSPCRNCFGFYFVAPVRPPALLLCGCGFVVVLLSSAITGTIVSLNVYMWTYFWELTTADLRWFPIAAIGAVGALPLIGKLQKRWDKKEILLTCFIVSLIEGFLIINSRFLGILPEIPIMLLTVLLKRFYRMKRVRPSMFISFKHFYSIRFIVSQ